MHIASDLAKNWRFDLVEVLVWSVFFWFRYCLGFVCILTDELSSFGFKSEKSVRCECCENESECVHVFD